MFRSSDKLAVRRDSLCLNLLNPSVLGSLVSRVTVEVCVNFLVDFYSINTWLISLFIDLSREATNAEVAVAVY